MIRLGAYDLVGPAGSGGAAEVWEAYHRASGVRVAVKVLSAENVLDDVFQRSFRNEVRSAARLDHPHVIRVHDHGSLPRRLPQGGAGLVPGAPFSVMEWVSGGPVRTAQFTRWEDVADLAMALLSALAHAHARGVVHRDVKPGNVLRSAPGDARPGLKLTDFAGSLWRFQRPGAAPNLGTPAYLPPERLRGAWWEEGPSSDLYSLGCMLWRALTGDLPHGGRTADDILQARLRGRFLPFAPRFAVPPGVEAWLRRLCAPGVRQRFPDAASALRALLEICGGRPEALGRSPTEIELLLADLGPGEGMPRNWQSGRVPAPVADHLLVGKLELRPVPLVGRHAERAALWRALGEVRASGRARAVVLTGASGFGKTVLAQWLAEHAEELGVAEHLVAQHAETAGVQHGLGPMLGRWLRVQGLPRSRALPAIESRLAGYDLDHTDNALVLAELVGSAQDLDDGHFLLSQPGERHGRMRGILAGLAHKRPVVLILDDLHWGSEARAFLQELLDAPDEEQAPVLVLATWSTDRGGDRDGIVEELARLRRHLAVDLLPVGPMAPVEVEQLLRQELGLASDLATRVQERAAGCPAYALQLVENWVQRGMLVPDESGFRLQADAQVALPASTKEVWLERLEPLLARWPSPAAEALELGAVLGQQVATGEWTAVCRSLGVEPPIGLVEALADAGLVAVQGGDSWGFVHAMLRDSLVARARRGGRLLRHHQACARVLAGSEVGRLDGRLGRHLIASGDMVAALAPLGDAAEAAMDLGEYARAEVLLLERDSALRQAGLAEDDPRWGRGWLAWCRLLRVQGREDKVRAMAGRTVDAGERYGWRRHVVQALVYLGRSEIRAGNIGRAWRRLLEAEKLAREVGEDVLLADALRAQGLVQLQRGDLDRAAERIQAALAAIDQEGDPLRTAGSLLDLAYVARQRGDAAQGHRLAARARSLYVQVGSRWGVANTHNLEGELARLQGDTEEAIEHYRIAARRSAAVGGRLSLIPRVNLGLALIDSGRAAEARPGLLAALGELGSDHNPALHGTLHAALSACAAAGSDWSGMLHHLAMTEQVLDASGYVDRDIPAALTAAARLALAAGREVEAQVAVDLARQHLCSLGDEPAAEQLLELLPRGLRDDPGGGEPTNG